MIQITLTLPENHPFCVQLLSALMVGGAGPMQKSDPMPTEAPKAAPAAKRPKLSPAEDVAANAPVAAPAGPPVPELDVLKDASRKLISACGGTTDELQKLFTQFKISRVSDLPDNKRATFLAAVQAATKVA